MPQLLLVIVCAIFSLGAAGAQAQSCLFNYPTPKAAPTLTRPPAPAPTLTRPASSIPLPTRTQWFPINDFGESRANATANLLADGRVLVVGGGYAISTYYPTPLFGTVTGNNITWVSGTTMPASLSQHVANILNDGRIFVGGGNRQLTVSSYSASALTYLGTISGNNITWVSSTNLPASTDRGRSSTLADGRILVSGGLGLSATRFGTVSANSITWVTGSNLPASRYWHSSTLLPDGRILILGGRNSSNVDQATAYLGTINNTSITWVTSTNMPTARSAHTTILLRDNRLLVMGGGDTLLGTVSGTSISWSATPQSTEMDIFQASLQLSDCRIALLGAVSNSMGFLY